MVFMSVELVIQCLQSNPESHQNHFIEYTSGHLIQTTESQKKKTSKKPIRCGNPCHFYISSVADTFNEALLQNDWFHFHEMKS